MDYRGRKTKVITDLTSTRYFVSSKIDHSFVLTILQGLQVQSRESSEEFTCQTPLVGQRVCGPPVLEVLSPEQLSPSPQKGV